VDWHRAWGTLDPNFYPNSLHSGHLGVARLAGHCEEGRTVAPPSHPPTPPVTFRSRSEAPPSVGSLAISRHAGDPTLEPGLFIPLGPSECDSSLQSLRGGLQGARLGLGSPLGYRPCQKESPKSRVVAQSHSLDAKSGDPVVATQVYCLVPCTWSAQCLYH
jgi:hypothetical protein